MAPGRLPLAYVVAALTQLGEVAAWSRAGHERIHRVAEGLLKGKRRDQVRTLLREDLFEAGGWELAMTGKYPSTKLLHWHRQNPDWTCSSELGSSKSPLRCEGKATDDNSLLCALWFFFDQFSHSQLLQAYPKSKDPITLPKALPALSKLPVQELSPPKYMRWLVTLLGDLHQPLHWLRGEHIYGRRIKVNWKGTKYTLLELWEDILPKSAPPPPDPSTLEKEFQERAMKWGYETPPELFRDWAQEVAEVACSQIYAPMEVNHADGSRNISQPYEVSEEMYQKWAALFQDLTVKAGERMAFILQDILEHRRHKHAHKEGRGHLHHSSPWKRNLATNAMVAVVVVPLTLLGLRLHARRAAAGGRSGKGLLAMLFPKDDVDKS